MLKKREKINSKWKICKNESSNAGFMNLYHDILHERILRTSIDSDGWFIMIILNDSVTWSLVQMTIKKDPWMLEVFKGIAILDAYNSMLFHLKVLISNQFP